jgi:hypothetical protein
VTKFADVLTMEYMSSDESDMDEKPMGMGLNNTTCESLPGKAEI